MVKIVYQELTADAMLSLQAEGHAGYAPAGQDIVCAAVSTLLQTLAYSVDNGEDGGAIRCDGCRNGPVLTVQARASTENRAKFELVTDGLYLLAQQYPENVQLLNLCESGTDSMDLQLFAEGAAESAPSAAGAAAPPEGAPSAVQEPALRPAQERLARRSGAMKGKSQNTGEKLPQPPAGGSPLGDGALGKEDSTIAAADAADAKEEKQEEAPAAKAMTPEEKRKAFGELVRGEYSDIFNEVMEQAAIKAGEAIRADPKYTALGQALSEAYGVDAEDVDGLIEAVKNGRVKDEAYYEQMAQQRGVSVKTARELDKMESDLRRSNAQNARLQQMQQEAARQQRADQIRAKWEAQAAQLKAQYPDFELQEVLGNEQVGDLMRRGVSLPDAYRAVYFDHILQQATAQTAQQTEQGVVNRMQQRANRPSENGTRPGGAATTHFDINNTTRRQREELERRARRGEKITL